MKGPNSLIRYYPQLALLCSLCSIISAKAQLVVTAPQAPRTIPYAAASSSKSAESFSSINSTFSNLEPLAVLGALSLTPYINYNVTYGDGILRVPGEPTNTAIHSFTAGVGARYGKYTSFDYSVTQTIYSSRLLENNAGDNASVTYGRSYESWQWGFTQSYSSSKPFLVETAQQTDHQTYSTGLNFGYDFGERTRVGLNAVRSVREAGPTATSAGWTGSDWIQWTTTGSVNYTFSSKLSAGLSMVYGYDEVTATSDMSSFRPQANVYWQPTNKISISLQRGVERRKVEGDGNGYITNPVYSTSLTYRPRPTTSFFGGGSRNVSVSYFNEQLVRNIQWNVGIEQRLLQRFYLTGTVAHGDTAYISTGGVQQAGRDDSFVSYGLRATTRFLRGGTVGLSYDLSENSSTINGFTFRSHQIGGNIGYRF
jgi:hypothetical protein